MIPVAQLDSATLALWLDLSPLYSSPHRQTFETAVLAAAHGDVNAALKALTSLRSTRTRIRGLHLTSLVWHEQRHFLDLVATNYGAHRFRHHAAVYQNVLALLADQAVAGSPLIVPVQYHFDLFARHKGISSGPWVKTQVESIMRKRAAARADRLQIPFGDRTVDVGGEQVLEALGFLHQHWSVANVSDGELTVDVLTDLPQRLQRNAVYEWPIGYMRALEIAPPDELIAYPIFDGVRLLSAILLASLFKPFMDTSASSRGVARRLEMLWAEFRGDEARRLRGAPFGDCWAAVSAVARRLWGRSLEEDLEHDLMLQDQQWIRPLRARFTYDFEPAPVDIVAEYQALRESVFDRLVADGPGFLDPTRGPTADCGPIVLPTPISVWPASANRPPDGHVSLFGGTAQAEREREPFASWTWGWAPERWPPEGTEDPLAFRSGDSWRRVVRVYAPAAKLLLNGFRHRTMLGPELEQALEYMRSVYDVEVHPRFGYSPAETGDLDQLFFLAESNHLVCDVCGGFVHEGRGKIVSPTEIRSDERSAAAAQAVYERLFAGVPGAELQAAKDWSGWVTCEVCIDLLRPQRRSAMAEAREMLAMAERLRSNLAVPRSEADTAMLAVAAAVQRGGDFEEAAERYRHLVDNGDPETVPLAAFSLGVVSFAYIIVGFMQLALEKGAANGSTGWPFSTFTSAYYGAGPAPSSGWANSSGSCESCWHVSRQDHSYRKHGKRNLRKNSCYYWIFTRSPEGGEENFLN